MCSHLPAFAGEEESAAEEILAPPVELKRKAFALWKIKERYGVEFDPEQAICYGCKAKGEPVTISAPTA